MPTQPAPPGPCILVVDDDPLIRRMVGRVLRRRGYVVVEAGTGGECLRLLGELTPDLMIVDYHLPDMTGERLVSLVRALPAPPPALVLTAADVTAVPGAVAVHHKPFSPHALADVVARQLALR